MDKDMFTFFPHGIRALIVDDDQKFLKSATMMLDLLHFKVVTCGSPTSALRLLSDEGSLKDVDVVLADAQKIAASGFDLRAIVEPDLGIPVIYFMSTEGHPTPVEGDDSSVLFQIVQSATYIIKKPLDASELTSLWRVVAFRKCVLDARGANARASSSAGRQDGSQSSSLPAGASPTDDDGEEEAARVHYKMVTIGGRRKKQANSHSGAGGHPSKIQDSRNMEGQNFHQVASHSQRPKHRTNKGISNTSNRPLCLDGRRPRESVAVANPTLNTSPCNPQFFTEHAGPSNIAGGSSSAVEQPSSVAAASNAVALATAFTGNAALARSPWPAGNFCGIMPQVATPAEEQQSSSTNQNQANFPQLSFGPFPYQGPFPPPSGQDKITLDNPVGSLVPVSLDPCVAPPSESEIEALLASITDLPAPENNVSTQDFEAVAAEAEQREAATMAAELMDVPLDNEYLLGVGAMAAPAATDDDILFPLDDILWPGGLMDIDSGGFVDGASGSLDGMRDDMGSLG